jgi:histidine ammonia-lyase
MPPGVGYNLAAVSTRAAIVLLDDKPLSLADLGQLLGQPLDVQISEACWQRVRESRRRTEDVLASGRTVYGINTGFGQLKNVVIPPQQVRALQENLLMSHAVGTGPAVPLEIVRLMMLFKLKALTAGYSGVQPETVQLLRDLLGADALPVVPSRGSLGASGDLAPLAHLVLPLVGRGQISRAGKIGAAAAVLKTLGLRPVRLEAKEGLALINGTQFMSAAAAACIVRCRALAREADLIGSMSLEALLGSAAPFDARLHAIRPHAGAVAVAVNFRALLAGSAILPSHAGCNKVQDPYSLRCIPQVHGASRQAIEHAAGVVETEINSVTDNPILFEGGDVISGGNFHGQPLALALDYLAIAAAELASISERRIYLLLDAQDGLPPMLVADAGLNSGLMMLQYTAAALVNENKVLCTPASVDTIPTSRGQEDHVSMGATSANKLLAVVDNAEQVLALEALCAAQALQFRMPLQAGLGPRAAAERLRREVAFVECDREMGPDIAAALRLVRAGALTAAAEDAVGPLQ